MKLSVSTTIIAVLLSSVFASAAEMNKATESMILKLKDEATWHGYFQGLHLIDDSLSAKHEQKLSADERASNEAKSAQLKNSIEALLVTADFSSNCRLALREIAKDAQTASFLRTASTAASSVGANKLTQETLKISRDIFNNGRTHGQLQYHAQNVVNNCQQ